MNKAKFYPKNTMVLVNWDDAWYSNYNDEDHKPLALQCMGHVMKHDEVGIKMAMEIGPAGPRQLKFIPAAIVTKVTVLVPK